MEGAVNDAFCGSGEGCDNPGSQSGGGTSTHNISMEDHANRLTSNDGVVEDPPLTQFEEHLINRLVSNSNFVVSLGEKFKGVGSEDHSLEKFKKATLLCIRHLAHDVEHYANSGSKPVFAGTFVNRYDECESVVHRGGDDDGLSYSGLRSLSSSIIQDK